MLILILLILCFGYASSTITETSTQRVPISGTNEFGRASTIYGEVACIADRASTNRHVNCLTYDVDATDAWYYDSVAAYGSFFKLQAPDNDANLDYGYDLKLIGTTMFVSAPGKDSETGAVYQYTLNKPAYTWTLDQTITYSGASIGDRFGEYIDYDGSRLVVGGATTLGTTVVYYHNGSSWVVQHEITPGAKTFDSRVGISGDVVAMTFTDNSFTMYDISGVSEVEIDSKLVSGKIYTFEVDNNRVAIGLYQQNSNDGQVRTYLTDDFTSYSQEQVISGPSGQGSLFGVSMELQGHFLMIGGVSYDSPSSNAGSAWVYQYVNDVDEWTDATLLSSVSIVANDFAGRSVAISPTGATVYTGETSGSIWFAQLDTSGTLPPTLPGGATAAPSTSPTFSPTISPTLSPTKNPTTSPTVSPTKNPTTSPTKAPTDSPTTSPTKNPTTSPTVSPTESPSVSPTSSPTESPTPSPTSGWTEINEVVTAPIPTNSEVFGSGIAISDGKMVICEREDGDNSGICYAYLWNQTGVSLIGSIKHTDSGVGDEFGASVFMHNEHLIVSGTGNDQSTRKGKIYCYNWDGSQWVEGQSIQPAGLSNLAYYGDDVTLDDDKMIVGAKGHDTVYTYTWSGTQWDSDQTIQPTAVVSGDFFGDRVSLYGDRLAVSARRAALGGSDRGEVYTFYWSGSAWVEDSGTITSNSPVNSQNFGAELLMTQDMLFVHSVEPDASGSVQLFSRVGSTYTYEDTFTTPGGSTSFDYFGTVLASSNNTLIVSGQGANTDNVGAVYTYTWDGSQWGYTEMLLPNYIQANENFGHTLAIDQIYLAVAGFGTSSSGEVQLYVSSTSTLEPTASPTPAPSQSPSTSPTSSPTDSPSTSPTKVPTGSPSVSPTKAPTGSPTTSPTASPTMAGFPATYTLEFTIQNPETVASSDYFGSAISVYGDDIVIGAEGFGGNEGNIYYFKRNGTDWIHEQTFRPAEIGTSDFLGSSLEIYDGKLLIGAELGDNEGSASGVVYYYELSGKTWSIQQTIAPISLDSSDFFGTAVSMNDDFALMGAPGYSSNAGRVYLYSRSGSVWSEETFETGGSGDRLGASTSVGEIFSASGAPNGNKVYVFDTAARAEHSSSPIFLVGANSGDGFGTSVSVYDNYLAVGIPGLEKVKIYHWNGASWDEFQELTGSGTTDYGYVVHLDNEHLVVSSKETSGTVHTYKFNSTSEQWTQNEFVINAPNGFSQTFGNSLSIYNDYLAVGDDRYLSADDGAVFMYSIDLDTFSPTPSPTTPEPTVSPTTSPSVSPTLSPTASPTHSSCTSLTGGQSHTCVDTQFGVAHCWGTNLYGILGDGGQPGNSTARPVEVLTNPIMLSAGNLHTCAIDGDKTVKCWGNNDDGQLGDGTNDDSDIPVEIDGLIASNIGCNGAHCCAVVESTGDVKCWGDNANSQLGDGTTTPSNTPVSVSGLPEAAVQVSVGYGHSCARLTDNRVYCWGQGNSGQLGDGTGINSATPVEVFVIVIALTVSDFTCGAYHCCGISDVNDNLYCWGSGTSGETGSSGYSNSDIPNQVLVASREPVQMSLGHSFTCVLYDDNKVRCFGSGSDEKLGDGTVANTYIPTETASLGDGTITDIGGGVAHTCVVLDNGEITCWGQDSSGQLGSGTDDGKVTTTDGTCRYIVSPSPTMSPTMTPTKSPTQFELTNHTVKNEIYGTENLYGINVVASPYNDLLMVFYDEGFEINNVTSTEDSPADVIKLFNYSSPTIFRYGIFYSEDTILVVDEGGFVNVMEATDNTFTNWTVTQTINSPYPPQRLAGQGILTKCSNGLFVTTVTGTSSTPSRVVTFDSDFNHIASADIISESINLLAGYDLHCTDEYLSVTFDSTVSGGLGRVRVYKWETTGWDLLRTFKEPSSGDRFGENLHLADDNNHLMVSAPGTDSNGGVVYFYTVVEGELLYVIEPDESVQNSYFGYGATMQDNWMVTNYNTTFVARYDMSDAPVEQYRIETQTGLARLSISGENTFVGKIGVVYIIHDEVPAITRSPTPPPTPPPTLPFQDSGRGDLCDTDLDCNTNLQCNSVTKLCVAITDSCVDHGDCFQNRIEGYLPQCNFDEDRCIYNIPSLCSSQVQCSSDAKLLENIVNQQDIAMNNTLNSTSLNLLFNQTREEVINGQNITANVTEFRASSSDMYEFSLDANSNVTTEQLVEALKITSCGDLEANCQNQVSARRVLRGLEEVITITLSYELDEDAYQTLYDTGTNPENPNFVDVLAANLGIDPSLITLNNYWVDRFAMEVVVTEKSSELYQTALDTIDSIENVVDSIVNNDDELEKQFTDQCPVTKTCSYRGTCDEETGTCNCIEGFTGLSCRTPIDNVEYPFTTAFTEDGLIRISNAYVNPEVQVGYNVTAEKRTAYYYYDDYTGLGEPNDCPQPSYVGSNDDDVWGLIFAFVIENTDEASCVVQSFNQTEYTYVCCFVRNFGMLPMYQYKLDTDETSVNGDEIGGVYYAVDNDGNSKQNTETRTPTASPTESPVEAPTTGAPSVSPTGSPSASPTTGTPTISPTTGTPSVSPTGSPSTSPTTGTPTISPTTGTPSVSPTTSPSKSPTTGTPTVSPTTGMPTVSPTPNPTGSPTVTPEADTSGNNDGGVIALIVLATIPVLIALVLIIGYLFGVTPNNRVDLDHDIYLSVPVKFY